MLEEQIMNISKIFFIKFKMILSEYENINSDKNLLVLTYINNTYNNYAFFIQKIQKINITIMMIIQI